MESVCRGMAVVGVGKGRISKREEVVSVKPKPRVGVLTSSLFDAAETLLLRLTHEHHCSSPYLTGNFSGVPLETPPVPHLPLSGHLPECLNGAFVRVGPNPRFKPLAGYHWFDGDGMIHGLRFKDGKATYVSRYVNTSRLQQEQLFGAPKFLKIGDISKGLFGLLMLFIYVLRKQMKILDFSYGAGTALTFHNGKLLALHEADKPYVVKIMEDGDLQTVGMLDYDNRLTHPFTAHPKIDPITGEMFAFGCSFKRPYLNYRVISRDGWMHEPVPITTKEPTLMHDFAITQNYAIFMDLPMYFRPKEILKEHSALYSFDATKMARFGVLPRYATDEAEIRWFELPSCFIFHSANAWEEGEEIVLITCRLEDLELDLLGEKANAIGKRGNELYEMRFNLLTGEASQKRLSLFNVEFPRINDLYMGRKLRYVYAAMMDKTAARVTGIVKYDLSAKAESGVIEFEAGTYGSDPVFVPCVPGYSSQEDDGLLIFFAHNELSGKSTARVMDAKTMSAEPVAVVELPSRVPYGFHAFFVTQEQIEQQEAQL